MQVWKREGMRARAKEREREREYRKIRMIELDQNGNLTIEYRKKDDYL